MVAGLTAASRGMGLVRTVIATAVLGLTYLGNTYASTNATSNLLFDLFAGGALAAVLVPSLSSALGSALVGDRSPAESVERRCSSSPRSCSPAWRCAAP